MAKKKINSRDKGARAERELTSELNKLLPVSTRRTQQYCGSTGEASDLVGIPGIHIECKWVEKLNVRDAMDQAIRDSKGKSCPTVFHKKNHKPWLVTFRLDDIIDFLTCLNRVLPDVNQCCTKTATIEAIAPDVARNSIQLTEGSSYKDQAGI